MRHLKDICFLYPTPHFTLVTNAFSLVNAAPSTRNAKTREIRLSNGKGHSASWELQLPKRIVLLVLMSDSITSGGTSICE